MKITPSRLFLLPFFMVFYEIATYLSNDMYLPALPDMMRDINLNTAQAQLTLTMWFLGQASLPLIAGVISDRYGRRPVLFVGGIFYILATLLCAMAQGITSLLIGRFIEGCMVATMLVPGYAVIHELYEKNEAIKILALMGSISVLAPALGPLFGGLLLYVTSWRGIFIVIAFLAALALMLLWKSMPETQPAEKREPILLTNLFTNYWRVLKNKRFMLLLLVLGFIFAGWIVWISAGSLLIIENFHYSAVMFGWIQAGIFTAYIGGNYLVKFLIDKLGAHRLINLGLLITLSGGILLLLSALTFPFTIYPFLAALTVYSVGSALCFSPLNRTIIESSTEPMGIRVSLFTVAVSVFAAIGSAAAGVFFAGDLASLGYLMLGAIVVACFLLIILRLE